MNLRAELAASLQALTDWACEHTSPRDPNSPHELLIKARAVLERAKAPATPEVESYTPGPWRWRCATDATGKLLGTFLESAAREKCSCNDPIVLAVREDWASTFGETGRPRYRRQFDRALIQAAPAMFERLLSAGQKLGAWDAHEEAPDIASFCAGVLNAE